MTPAFELHPRLAADAAPVCELTLCWVGLIDDARFPWLVLVPQRAGLRELHELDERAQVLLLREIGAASRALEHVFAPDKLNVGALGNLVPQLHVHVIARNASDAAWPGPVWGFERAVPYSERERARRIDVLRGALVP